MDEQALRQAFNTWYTSTGPSFGAYTNQGRCLQAFRAGYAEATTDRDAMAETITARIAAEACSAWGPPDGLVIEIYLDDVRSAVHNALGMENQP